MENGSEQMTIRKNIGKILAEKRIEKGLSSKDIEHVTRISRLFVEAIENGDFDKLPGKVFVRGFIKSISQFLDLDSKELLKDYDQAWTPPVETIEKKKEDIVSSRFIKNKRRSRTLHHPILNFFSRKLLFFYAAVFVIVIGLFGFARFLFLRESSLPVAEEPKAAEESVPPVESREEPKNEHTTVIEPEVKAVNSVEENMSLLILTVNKEVQIKHRVPPQDFDFTVFKPGTYQFKFENRADFHVSNASAVKINLNGKDLGVLGKEGEERKITFYASGLDDSKHRNELKF